MRRPSTLDNAVKTEKRARVEFFGSFAWSDLRVTHSLLAEALTAPGKEIRPQLPHFPLFSGCRGPQVAPGAIVSTAAPGGAEAWCGALRILAGQRRAGDYGGPQRLSEGPPDAVAIGHPVLAGWWWAW